MLFPLAKIQIIFILPERVTMNFPAPIFFVPGYEPVNVILPDNAWETGIFGCEY